MKTAQSSDVCLKHGPHAPGECPQCDELAEARMIVSTVEIPAAECNCVLADDLGPPLVCEAFDRDEEGYCFTCGHAESCHVE